MMLNYFCYPQIPSTQDLARAYLAEEGRLAYPVVFRALQQTQGYGRKGHNWVSPLGNLLVSILMPLKPHPMYRSHLAYWGAQAVAEVLTELGTTPQIKWPNDIFVQGKKVGGLLGHLVEDDSKTWQGILGIGLNVNALPLLSDAPYEATSLRQILGYSLDLEKILQTILKGLLPRLTGSGTLHGERCTIK